MSAALTDALLFHVNLFCCGSKTRASFIRKRVVFFTAEIAYRKNVSPGNSMHKKVQFLMRQSSAFCCNGKNQHIVQKNYHTM